MPPRVGQAYWRHQRQLAAKWHDGPFPHEDAMAACLGRDSRPIAREVGGIGGRTLRSWKDRYDSEHRGPARTLALTMHAALKLGRHQDEALAPLHALAWEFGFLLLDPGAHVADAGSSSLNLSSAALKESGEAIQALAESVRNADLAPAARAEISRQAREAAQAYMNIAYYVENPGEKADRETPHPCPGEPS